MPRKRRVEFEDDDFDLVEEAIERLMDHPRAQAVLDRATVFFDEFGILVDRAANRAVDRVAQRATLDAKQRAQHEARYRRLLEELHAARQRINKEPKRDDPRIVLGFGPQEPLDAKKIKARQRQYAAIVHPDKGGSTEAMQRVNVAAAELLKEIK